MSGPWIEPTCASVTDLAPSTVNALVECPKRVAFQRDSRTRELSRPNTRTALGQAAHRLTELVLQGRAPEPSERRPWLEDAWDKAIAHEAEVLADAWKGRQVPSPARWPGYVATRTRLLRRLTAAVVATNPTPRASPAKGGQPPLPWVERKLVDDEIGLYGTPDLVEDRGGSVRVVDLKSGVHQHEVQPSQRRQLLLYAHLASKVLSRSVCRVAVVDVRGQETEFSVGPSEIEEQTAKVLEVRRNFNASLASGTGVEARPAADSCRFCPFKVVCRAYFDARQDDWSSDVAIGTVIGMPLPNVAIVADGDDEVRIILYETSSVRVGDQLAVSGLEPAGPRTLRMRWDSRVVVG